MRRLYLLSTMLMLAVSLAACTPPVLAPEETSTEEGASTMEESMAELPEIAEGELTVSDVRANLTLPTDTGSVWLVIMNGTGTDDVLTGVEVPGCGVVELHDMMMEGDVMIMRPVEGGQIPIPAGETVELKKGGLHVMCINKEAPLELGSQIAIVLHFANAGDVEATGEVVAPGASGMQTMQGEGNMAGKGGMGKGGQNSNSD